MKALLTWPGHSAPAAHQASWQTLTKSPQSAPPQFITISISCRKSRGQLTGLQWAGGRTRIQSQGWSPLHSPLWKPHSPAPLLRPFMLSPLPSCVFLGHRSSRNFHMVLWWEIKAMYLIERKGNRLLLWEAAFFSCSPRAELSWGHYAELSRKQFEWWLLRSAVAVAWQRVGY